jgi:hypothetical protein
MKNYLYVLFLFFIINLSAQEGNRLKLVKQVDLSVDKFLGVNVYDELFYINKDILFKQTKSEKLSYQNNLYGNLNNVDIINYLETTLFYKDFNTVIQLDRWLGEFNKVDFIQSNIFSSIQRVSIASNNRLWVFNDDTLQLQIYSPKLDIVVASSQPVQDKIIDCYSNYNFYWILTETKLLKYNIYGNELNSYNLEGFDAFTHFKNSFILKKLNQLYFFSEKEKVPELLTLPKLTIKDFSVTNETLYIYDGKELYSFKINQEKE